MVGMQQTLCFNGKRESLEPYSWILEIYSIRLSPTWWNWLRSVTFIRTPLNIWWNTSMLSWLTDWWIFFQSCRRFCCWNWTKYNRKSELGSIPVGKWQWEGNHLQKPGEMGSKVWPVFAFLWWAFGGKLPCSGGWLTGNVFGKLTAKGAVKKSMEEHIVVQY